MSLIDIEKKDHTWFFRFDDESAIVATDSLWRFVGPKRIIICSEDHNHQFGLQGRMDAEQILKKAAVGKAIDDADIDQRTGDLTITMGVDFIEFLCTSIGYEAWHLTSANLEVICMGGGKIEQIEKS